MITVSVDRAVCENHGQCVFAAPDVFSFDEDEELVFTAHPDRSSVADVEAAVGSCPVRAIALRLSDDGS